MENKKWWRDVEEKRKAGNDYDKENAQLLFKTSSKIELKSILESAPEKQKELLMLWLRATKH